MMDRRLVITQKEWGIISKIDSMLRDCTEEEYHNILLTLGWKRPWKWVPEFWSKENWLFQIYHIIYVCLVFGVPLAWPRKWWAWLFGSFIFMTGREFEQWKNWDWKVLMLPDRLMDVMGGMLGSQILFWSFYLFL